MKAALIINSLASKRRHKDWHPAFEILRSCQNLDCEVLETGSSGHAINLSADAVKAGFEMVVAVGGDGTVNECANGIMLGGKNGKTPVLGIIPLGSGCDLIRTLGIPREPVQAVKSLLQMRKKSIDLGRVEYLDWSGEKQTRFFINVADVGSGGVVLKHAAKSPRLFGKRPNYLWGILSSVISYNPQNITLQIDGNAHKRIRVRNVVFANGKYFGRGINVAPHAEMNDNLFDIVVLGDFSTAESIWHLPKMYAGKHLTLKKVQHYRTAKVDITSEEEVLLELDGELVGTVPTTFEIVPGALEIIY